MVSLLERLSSLSREVLATSHAELYAAVAIPVGRPGYSRRTSFNRYRWTNTCFSWLQSVLLPLLTALL